jgi:hypothetical protein
MKYRGTLILSAMLLLGVAAAAEPDEASIKKRVQRLKDSDVTGWRKIPWTSSLLAARRASEKEKQLLYLFTHDGNIDTGRC